MHRTEKSNELGKNDITIPMNIYTVPFAVQTAPHTITTVPTLLSQVPANNILKEHEHFFFSPFHRAF
jgi:hypothetical protein